MEERASLTQTWVCGNALNVNCVTIPYIALIERDPYRMYVQLTKLLNPPWRYLTHNEKAGVQEDVPSMRRTDPPGKR